MQLLEVVSDLLAHQHTCKGHLVPLCLLLQTQRQRRILLIVCYESIDSLSMRLEVIYELLGFLLIKGAWLQLLNTDFTESLIQVAVLYEALQHTSDLIFVPYQLQTLLQ